MLPSSSSAPEPEKPYDDSERSYHRAVQAMFRLNAAIPACKDFAVPRLVERSINQDGSRDSKCDTDADGDERQAVLRDRERVRWVLKDVGECGEEEEADAEANEVYREKKITGGWYTSVQYECRHM